MESSVFLNNLMCCIWQGQLFVAIMGGVKVDVCPHINWLPTFSLLLECYASVSLTKNIWLSKAAAESNSSFLSALQTSQVHP